MFLLDDYDPTTIQGASRDDCSRLDFHSTIVRFVFGGIFKNLYENPFFSKKKASWRPSPPVPTQLPRVRASAPTAAPPMSRCKSALDASLSATAASYARKRTGKSVTKNPVASPKPLRTR